MDHNSTSLAAHFALKDQGSYLARVLVPRTYTIYKCMRASFFLTPSQLSLMASSIFLPLILFHLLLATEPTSSARILLTRVSRPKYTSTNSLMNNPEYYSPGRSPLILSNDVYALSLAIGTPPVKFSAIMDTGSNLIWTKCKSSGSGLYDTSMSTSFSSYVGDTCEEWGVGQDCPQNYDDGKSVNVTLGQETLTIGDVKVNDVTFGCGITDDENFGFDGIVGMGPGKLSLVSQLRSRVFYYCLGSRFDPTARRVFLTGSIPNTYSSVQTTPLRTDESNYYIILEGISVGETKLPITDTEIAKSNKDKGMVIDSGTTFTYLEKSIVDMISNEFMSQTNLNMSGSDNVTKYGLENCFNYQGYDNVEFPNVVFHFEGANWELKKDNYIYQKEGGEEGCLAFKSNDQENDKSAIFGNIQQQNMIVSYDLDNNKLSFVPADCNQV
ncbi:putative nepenthesin [Helianthus annuus]|nr:putative nepenthesin [Helianthus annuus]